MLYRAQPASTSIANRAPPTSRPHVVPASVGGINALDSVAGMPEVDCLYCHNLMPSEYGLRLRRGYREWARVPSGKEIRTMIPFEGQDKDVGADRLWAVTEDGIYDVTNYNTTDPTLVVMFDAGLAGPTAGRGVFVEVGNDADDRFLQYADEANGLYQYEESTDAWTKITTEITSAEGIPGNPFDATKVAFVTSWKNRLWYIERNSGAAWYLPPDAIQGEVTKFTFGSKFPHGGDLLSLWSWTIDGGNGADDLLIAISRGGDVLVYRGTDPSTVQTFGMIGSWYVGEFPESRKLGVAYGGELYMLSTFGVTSLRDLLQGVDPIDQMKTPSAKINRYLRNAVEEGKDRREWAMTIYPTDGFLQIIAPWETERADEAVQFNQNLMTRAWGMWRGVPANCASTWSGRYMIGGKEGKIWDYDGTTDGSELIGPNHWQSVLANPLPSEWTSPETGVYVCDGNQIADTEVDFQSLFAAVAPQEYTFVWTVTDYVAGACGLQFGDAVTPLLAGNGTFTIIRENTASGPALAIYLITEDGDQLVTESGLDDIIDEEASGAEDIITLHGNAQFEGTVSLMYVGISAPIGNPIPYDILTSFQSPGGNHTSEKRVGFIRPILIESSPGSLNVAAIYDYDIFATLDAPPSPTIDPTGLWDSAIWDEARWDSGFNPYSTPIGSMGMGRTVAVAMRGEATSRLTFVGWDMNFTEGGFL